MIDEALEERLLHNPHFSSLFKRVEENGINRFVFSEAFCSCLDEFLNEHRNDNPVLRDEEENYILPAIAAYQTLKQFSPNAYRIFREMWLEGAEKGAAYLQGKAKDEAFLSAWCKSVTPKNEDAGAFLFRIEKSEPCETEYHVLRCPYVALCNAYSCPEIVTVFCDSDDISFGNIHPRMEWRRSRTIGRGDDICDFHYVYRPHNE